MEKDIVKMKTPDGLLINVDCSCVAAFEKAGYKKEEPETEPQPPEEVHPPEESQPVEKKRKASK